MNQQEQNILDSACAALAINHDSLSSMCHMRFSDEPLPQQATVTEIVGLSRALIFPGFFGTDDINSGNIASVLNRNCNRLLTLLENQITAGLTFTAPCSCTALSGIRDKARQIALRFIAELPQLKQILHTDVEAIFNGDPAAAHMQEVIYCYPAVKAISAHRIAHFLHSAGVPVIPRMISEMAHSETGIDIHPGAKIGHHFAIDHGTGVVIGETTVIGHDVKLYQGVTLGARSFPTDDNGNPIKGIARHPIIGNNVVIYSNATILGRINIGDNAVIGGNVWLTHDVPQGGRILQAKTQ